MKRPQIGDTAAITFWDHVEGAREPERFTVYGVIQKLHDDYVVVASWAYPDGKPRDDENETVFTILTAVITKIRILK